MSLFSKPGGDRVAVRQDALPSDASISVIGSGTKVVGDLESTGVIKVDGVVEGSIRSAKQMLLGRGGSIHGDVCADEVILGGTVIGSVTAAQRAEVQSTCSIQGDIQTKSIVVLEGGVINGTVRMENSANRAPANGARTPVVAAP